MVNEQEQLKQVEWVSPEQESAPKPTRPRPSGRWVLPVVVAVTVLVVLIIAIVVVIGFGNRTSDREIVENEMSAATFDCQEARDVEKCVANVAPRLAKEHGDSAYCSKLEGEPFDLCVNGAAVASRDRTECKVIKNTDRQEACEDAVLALTITDEDPPSVCEDFHDGNARINCLAARVIDEVLSGNCDAEYVTEALCSMGGQYRLAVEQQNPDLCEEITDSHLRSHCNAVVSPGDRDFDSLDADEEATLGTSDTNTDSDGDGLMDGEEVHQHGTDPANADTDGDSFDDKTEIDNGFDPLA